MENLRKQCVRGTILLEALLALAVFAFIVTLLLGQIHQSRQTENDLLKKEEAKLFLNQIDNADLVILLDEKGKEFTSRQFSEKIDFWLGSSVKKVNFLIGGAYGFSDEIYQRANEKISLSKLTFTHQMIRLFFVEQIYRASTILQGKPYHND